MRIGPRVIYKSKAPLEPPGHAGQHLDFMVRSSILADEMSLGSQTAL